MNEPGRIGLNGFTLKMIALATMMIDHTGAALFPGAQWMRIVGRIAFPIYIFLIAEGTQHTRSMGKYALRLFLFALVSEVPFDIALYMRGAWNFTSSFLHQNVYFTLLLGVLAVWAFRGLRKLGMPAALALLAVVPCAVAAELGRSDYAWLGVLAIFVCSILLGKWWRLGAVAAFAVAQYVPSVPYLAAALLALLPIALYNGSRGPSVRWAFYAAYPAHLAVLAVLRHVVLPLW